MAEKAGEADGMEAVRADSSNGGAAVRERGLSRTSYGSIKAAIETWDPYGAAVDRRWLEPLVEALFSADTRHTAK